MNEKRDAENHCIISDKANVTISWRAIRYSSSKIHDILFHRKFHFQIPETYLAKFVVPCKDIKPMKPKIKLRHYGKPIVAIFNTKIQFQFNEIQFQFNEIQVQFNEIQFQFNEIQFQFNEIQVQFNEIQVQFNFH